MQRLSKFISNLSALQYVQLLRFGILFLIGIVFVRYVSVDEIGKYETLILIAGAVTFFWLQGVLKTFLSAKDEINNNSKNSIFFNVFVIILIFSILVCLFLIIFKTSFQNILNSSKEIPYFNWLILYILTSSPANLTEYIYLIKNKPKSIIVYGTVSFFIHFIALASCVIFTNNIENAIVALVLVNALRFVWLIIVLKKYSLFKIDYRYIVQHLKLAYPLIGSFLLSGSAQYIDGLIITHFYDESTFAIFRYGARELPLVIIMANALSNAMIPEFGSLSIKDALAKLKTSCSKLMHLLYPTTLFLLIFSNWLFVNIFNSEFVMSAQIFNIYLLLIVSRLAFPQTILIGLHKTKPIMWTSLVEIIINISASIFLVKKIGVIGVAYSTILAYYVEKVILAIVVRKNLNIKLSEYLNIGWYSAYSIITIILFSITNHYLF